MNKKEDKVQFSQRHPKLVIFITIIIMLLAVAFALFLLYIIIKYFVELGYKALDFLSNVTTKLDAVVIVSLITGAVSILGVVISSVVAKRIEFKKQRQAYLAQKREKAYGEFIEMFYKIQQNAKNPGSYTDQAMTDDVLAFSQELTLWGSKKVANKWVSFRLNAANAESATKNIYALEDIMNEMRKDMGVNRLRKGRLMSFIINDLKPSMKVKK